MQSGILIHAAIWPQRIWAENWGAMEGYASLEEGKLDPHLTQCDQAEAYLHAKFYLDPPNRLAIIHQRYRQDRQTDRQTTVQ